MKCLVCDFGGSSVKYAIIDENANILKNGKAVAPLNSEEEFVELVFNLYKRFACFAEGISISVPGVVDSENGVHYGSGAYSSILKNKNVAKLIKNRCKVDVALENDGKCGALSELWKGALKNISNGVVLILGTGVAGGVIIDGKIQKGMNFSAGEFSFAITDLGDYSMLSEAWMNVGMLGMTYKTCKIKNLDLSVQDASPILEKFNALFSSKYPTYVEVPQKIKVDGKRFFSWLDDGDKDVEEIYSGFLHSLAVLIHNIHICFAPERVVIGGGLSRVERLLPDIRQELKKLYTLCNIPSTIQAQVYRSEYLDESNLLGAMYNYLRLYGGI